MTRSALIVDATGQPDVDLAAELGVPLLLALLTANDSRRPSLKIAPCPQPLTTPAAASADSGS